MTRLYTPWTDTEKAVMRAADGKLTARQLEKRLPGRNVKDIGRAAKRFNIPIKIDRRFSLRFVAWNNEAENTLITKAVQAGLTSRQTSDLLAANGFTRSAGSIRQSPAWIAARKAKI